MTKQEEMNKLEEQAKGLVSNLNELHKEIGSYKIAKDEMQKVTETLQNFVKETKGLAEDSSRVIEKLNEIGSVQIVQKLDKLQELDEERTKKQNKIFIIAFGVIIILQLLSFFL